MTDLFIGSVVILFIVFYVYKVFSNQKRINKSVRPIGWKEIKGNSLRPLGWVIILFNVYWVYRLLKGLYDIGLSGTTSGLIGVSAVLFIILWLLVLAAVNVVLYVIYRVTEKRNPRLCPACGVKVEVGLTICPKCRFDFAKAAGA
jgi:hypothetical protein